MPATDLTRLGPTTSAADLSPLITAVESMAAGTRPSEAARQAGVDLTTLLAADERYRQAGRAALEALTGDTWLQANVEFTDREGATGTVAAELASRLDALLEAGLARRWWFIRKHPHWRIRLQAESPASISELAARVNELGQSLTRSDRAATWVTVPYEPETIAFGGDVGMEIAHELFSIDSRHIIDHLGGDASPLGTRETSILLCLKLFRAARLDWFETGDVWRRVADLRPLPADVPDQRLTNLAGHIQRLVELDTGDDGPLFGDGGPLHSLIEWSRAFGTAGEALSAGFMSGQLDRGLRAVLAHHVIFHWNRMGLSARRQAFIAHAAAALMLNSSSGR